ncbi:PAS domain-containing sensor histidine kinase [Chryseobacterium tongliaoense]|uniref:PAS domain-containing sensor histidine kinase n=1 Tax=Chryseobacterium tongliaoense TaxID=3240933 RepID=UPI0035156399
MDTFDLGDKQALLNAIIMSSDDAIVSKSLSGIITSWNLAAERIFGYSADEAIGKHISLIIPTDRLEEEDYIIGQIKSGNKVDHFETVRKKKNGDLFPISVTVSPVINGNGEIIGASKIARDISERYQLHQENAELLEKLQELNVKKDEFIALASHELRTPLTSLQSYLQVMARHLNDEKLKYLLEKALLQVAKLNILISDLLDVSKIEAGKLPLKIERFDIINLLKETMRSIGRLNSDFDITFQTDLDQQYLNGDPDRLEQVMINLLNNAIRYSAEDHRIIVSLGKVDDNIKIGVKDHGIGIDPKKFADIFCRFYQANNNNIKSGRYS